ncbi:hypothetical protein INR49_027752 [Caranx melampygus]|nr:hypothetical protein INR49_027752 [Caranx melampygus]
MINIKANIQVTNNKASSFKTLRDLASPAGQHGEVIRQQGVVSAVWTYCVGMCGPRGYDWLPDRGWVYQRRSSTLSRTLAPHHFLVWEPGEMEDITNMM